MEPKVTLMWGTPDPEYQIVRAARECYASEDSIDSHWEPTGAVQKIMMGGGLDVGVPMLKVKLGPNDTALLKTLMKNQHNTCLRFASAAFRITDISRVCSHQLVRIAHFGILQRSQRYCNEENTNFIFPDTIEDKRDAENVGKYFLEVYKDLIAAGVKEEDARYILPGATSTRINMVSNFQGWKHLLHIRLNKKVQLETRMVAAELCRQLYELAPIVFEEDFNKLDNLDL